jgi:hypothetical protein
MNVPDITNTSGRCVMDFPEAFKFIEDTAPDKKTHHPKCSYRQAGMLCDCSIIWAEYHKRRANGAEERERVLREALEWQPITPENLPKSGDEIYRAAGDRPNDVADVMAECGEYDAVELYHRYGFTHFRPINPPAAPEQPDLSEVRDMARRSGPNSHFCKYPD